MIGAGLLQSLHGHEDLLFLKLPFSGLALPEILSNLAVQLVHIGLVNTVANGCKALLQSLLLGLLFALGILLALGERILYLSQNIVGDVDVLEHLPEPLTKFFFSYVGKFAFSLVAGAMVVDVFLLLDLGGHHAVIVGTAEQTNKGEIVLSVFRPIVAMEHGLHLGEKRRADNQFVSAFILQPVPGKEPGIKRILQQLVKIAFLEGLAGLGPDGLAKRV